ncbi:MAG: hypothetical protein WCC01_01120 [Acidimicrobiia bacterium]
MSADASGAPHPPEHNALPRAARRWWLWAALALVTGAITVSAAGSFNIVDLELAGTLERADEVTAGTDPGTIRMAIYWDFVFIFSYVLALSSGSLWTRRQFPNGFGSKLGLPIAIGAVTAGVFDVVENLAMLGYLNGWGEWTGWIAVARAMAIPKFILVFISIAYILGGIGTWVFRRLSHRGHQR